MRADRIPRLTASAPRTQQPHENLPEKPGKGGHPLEDLSVIGASSEWFSAPPPGPIDTIRLIMKDGKLYKNTL